MRKCVCATRPAQLNINKLIQTFVPLIIKWTLTQWISDLDLFIGQYGVSELRVSIILSYCFNRIGDYIDCAKHELFTEAMTNLIETFAGMRLSPGAVNIASGLRSCLGSFQNTPRCLSGEVTGLGRCGVRHDCGTAVSVWY